MQIPSNMIVNRISRPSVYIAAAVSGEPMHAGVWPLTQWQMLLWGLISTLSGVVTNFTGMVLIRFFLGFIEAAFLPGALLILSKVRAVRRHNDVHG